MKKVVLSIVLSLAFVANVYSQYKIEEVLNFEQNKWQELKEDTLYVVLEDDTASNYNKEISLAVKENWKFCPFKFVYRNSPLAYESNKFYLSYKKITTVERSPAPSGGYYSNYLAYKALVITKGPYKEKLTDPNKLMFENKLEEPICRNVMALLPLEYNVENTNLKTEIDKKFNTENLNSINKLIEREKTKESPDYNLINSLHKKKLDLFESMSKTKIKKEPFLKKNLPHISFYVQNLNSIGEQIHNGIVNSFSTYYKFFDQNKKAHVNKTFYLLQTDISKEAAKKISKSTLNYKIVNKDDKLKAIKNKEDINIVFWNGPTRFRSLYCILMFNCKSGEIFYLGENKLNSKTNGGITKADLSSLTVQQQILKAGN